MLTQVQRFVVINNTIRRFPPSQGLRIAKPSWRRRSGSAIASISMIFAPAIVKLRAMMSRPPGATTTPTAPFTSAGCATRAPPLTARLATDAAPFY
jgi:hypothetical protein